MFCICVYWKIKRVLIWDFISGEMKYFHFGVWSISYNCLHVQPEMKLIASVISLWSFWQKWNFITGYKISCKHYPKWNHMKANICTCVNKSDWLLLNGPFISDHPRNEIHFISVAMKSNVNSIFFMVGWNFASRRFRYGSHVNTLLVIYINYTYHVLTSFRLLKIIIPPVGVSPEEASSCPRMQNIIFIEKVKHKFYDDQCY